MMYTIIHIVYSFSQAMNVEYIIPIMTFWHTISIQIAKYKSPQLANNAISFIHCVSFIAHYKYDYHLDYTVHASVAFFMYDLLYMAHRIYTQTKRNDEFAKQIPFIIHHFAGIFILYSALTEPNGYCILDAYILLENSNIMIYVSYYLNKQYTEYKHLKAFSDLLQLISYSYFRIIQLSLFIYENRETLLQYHFITQILIMMVYSMGYAWSYRLLKKNIHNYYTMTMTMTLKGNKSNLQ